MTFYHTRVLEIAKAVYPNDDLCRRVIRSKHFIDHHFAHSINLHQMAGNAFLSKYHYIRVFKSMYGRTPHRYLIEVRIAGAKKLLQSGMPVTQACFSVGFGSVTSFTALFKKITGVTPQTCRRKALQEKQF